MAAIAPILPVKWSDIPFSRSEFACKCCCGFNSVDVELLALLLNLRQRYGTTIINSGNRCLFHNEYVQKMVNHDYVAFSSKSYHIKGMAVDAKFPQAIGGPKAVYEYLCRKYLDRYGFILYHNRLHIDVRQMPHRAEKLQKL